MGERLAGCLLIIGAMIPLGHAVGTYSVLAPRVIRPNRDMNVVVSLNNAAAPVHVTVEVGGPQDSGGVIVNRQEADLTSESTHVLKFKIGDLGPGNYNLTVIGEGGLSFKNTTALEFMDKSYSVFIQTDRAIYKPGDLVQFRVIIVNPELRPSVTGAIDVHVTDGADNRVHQWSRVFTNKGVWSGSLQLSDEPVLGNWNISVNVLGQVTKSSFYVAYYVLPKFEVVVELPDYATFGDGTITATVKTKYSYGRDVKGEVTLQVTPTYKYGYLQAPYDDPIRVVKALKGKTSISLDIVKDLKLQGDYAREVEFTAFVQEELTGRVQNASAKVTVYKHPYKMELIRTSDSFKPGLKYTAFLKVARQDDVPIQAGEVTVRHAFSKDTSDFIETVHQIPSSGVITLEFFPPLDEEVLNLALEAKYKDLTQWLADLTRGQSPSNTFLQATLLTQDPQVGEEVKISLNATQPLVYFQYEVLGRGDVIYAQTLQAHDGVSHDFRFLATAGMAPNARLIVYYVKEDGEIVADSLHFAVDGAVQNKVTVSVTPRSVDVGEEVSITVSTKPRAFVGVSAIDQRSLMMSGSNYLLTQDTVLEELESYDSGRTAPDEHLRRYGLRKKRSFFNYHGTTTAADVFKNAGVVVLTNGLMYDYNPYLSGILPHGLGPVDGSHLDPYNRQPAINGPFNRPIAPSDVVTLKPDLGPGVEYNAPTRPPLAGPYAFSFLPPPPDDSPRVYLNQHLYPTWFFKDAETRFNGVVTLKEKVPDSITSYVISAFAVSDFHGLGVAQFPAKVTVFRPFFIALHLPSSVIRGEAVAIEMVVFNYMKLPISADVVLHNDGSFLFPDFVNELEQGSPATESKRNITIAPNNGVALSFMVVPQTLGMIPIKVSATSPLAGDTIVQNLMVKPEGSTLTVNKAILLDLREESSFSTSVNVSLPRNIVNDSFSMSVTIVGDVLGAAVTDLNDLLEIPTGCGEQNMAKLIPNIVLVEYLKNKNQLSEALINRAKMNMMSGYQRQLTYRHDDGSFSAFGKKDKSGSTWLTAFVVKSLAMAGRHMDVEDIVVKKGLEWLIRQQQVDGSFKEVGTINNEAIQGGATQGIPLTAYVTVALSELRAYFPDLNLRNPINRAIDFLASQVELGIDDVYSLALTSYALHLEKHPHDDTTFYLLEGKAKVEGDMKWWETGEWEKTAETTVSSLPLDVETTAYMLLTYTTRSLTKDALPLLRWLTAQRNQHGGFQSTQDTAVGMQALASIAEKISSAPPTINVDLIFGQRGENIQVNSRNMLKTQRVELPEDTRTVDIRGSGSGTAFVQVTYQYNVRVTAPLPAFHLDPQIDRTTDANKLRLVSCTSFKSANKSNMAVMDVDLPSGYVMDNDLIPGLYDYADVKRVEMKGEGKGVLIYFDHLSRKEVCPTVAAYRVAKVAFQKPTAVRVYDYYDLSRQARQFYEAAPATLCDICDLNECDTSRCQQQIIKLNRQLQDPDDEFSYPAYVTEDKSSSSKTTENCLYIILVMLSLMYYNR